MSIPPPTAKASCAAATTAPVSLGPLSLRALVTDAARHQVQESIDLQGIMWMEHINLVIGSAPLAEYFYLKVLGCTRDEGKSFHVNLGQQQFHLAENGEPAQVFAGGSIGLAVPDLTTLRQRIDAASRDKSLAGTQFRLVSDLDDCIVLQGPWGNLFYLYSVHDDDSQAVAPALQTPMKMVNLHGEGGMYGSHRMAVRGQPGIRFVEVPCPKGKSAAVATFYRELLGCAVWKTATKGDNDNDNDSMRDCAVVQVGPGVHVVFVEHVDSLIPEHSIQAMEGIHICVYVNDFAALYQRLSNRQLIWTNPRFRHLDSCDTWPEALASRTLRFKDIIDLRTGEIILQLEHETRPLRHGQYLKVPKYNPV
ncbi:hypothetical protein ACA910_015177 [Epithemia clementina (nom. ined.)]